MGSGFLSPAVLLLAAAVVLSGCGGGAADPTVPVASSTTTTEAAATTAEPPAATTTAAPPSTEEPGRRLPVYAPPRPIGTMREAGEPFVAAGDFDGDGDDDLVVARMRFQTRDTFPIEIHLNDDGRLVEATEEIFTSAVPTTQHVTDILVADFNGDGVDDVFISDHGYDVHPFPGYQNLLALSAPGGRMVDGTPGLPRQDDFTHSAAAGDTDVDGDGDPDLLVHPWADRNPDPVLWVNRDGRLVRTPFEIGLGYLYFDFSDFDGDGDPDVVEAGFSLFENTGCLR